jgi:glycosyltransferase involved in cell wall biosynthesis
MVVLEALCLQVLIAAHEVGGLPTLLGQGRHGVLVPSQEPAAWVEALRPVLFDAQWRRGCTGAGFEAVSSLWSATASAQRYVELYRQCLEKH